MLDLGLEVAQVGDGGGGDVRDLVRHRDQRRALALAEDVAGLRADRRRRRGAGGRRRRARALDAGVHVALVVVTDVEHVVVALEHPGQAAEADVDRAAVAALADDADVVAALGLQRGGDPGRDRGALPNSEWIHGSCHDLSGNGVEKTSRQPVALAAISRPWLARIAASSA